MGYGDFNNDLRTDYIALDPSTNNLLIYYYSNSPRDGEYVPNNSIPTNGCTPQNLYLCKRSTYLDDADYNFALDITIWGEDANSNKCLTLLLQNNGQFTPNCSETFEAGNTQPFLFESRASGSRRVYFLLFNSTNNSRTILEYNLGN
jgi:hypothetical protein